MSVSNVKRAALKNPESKLAVQYPNWVLRLVITNTCPELIKSLWDEFGGAIHIHSKPKKGWRQVYMWYTTRAEDSAAVLRGMLPHLRYKKLEAQLGIEFLSGVKRSTRLTSEEAERRTGIVEKIRAQKIRLFRPYNSAEALRAS